MADPMAPDYYEQERKEVEERLERERKEILARISEESAQFQNELKLLIVKEFGVAVTRDADLYPMMTVVWRAMQHAARVAAGMVTHNHVREIEKSSRAMLEAVFAGMELAKREKGEKEDDQESTT